MGRYREIARRLQEAVIQAEYEAGMNYGDHEVRRAVVHARQDVILLVSHLSSLNSQVAWIKRGIWTLVAIGALNLFRV